MFLDSSTITMKDIRGTGVPCGRRCLIMWLVFLIHPNIIILLQNIRDSGSVNVRCEVTENTCGYSAMKFVIEINRNVIIIMVFVPFPVFPIENFTSFFSISTVDISIFFVRFVIFHVLFLIISTINSDIVSVIFIMDILGSKIENRLVIIL